MKAGTTVRVFLPAYGSKARFLLQVIFYLAQAMIVHAQFSYTTNNGVITITGYSGSGPAVTIPATINGYPVTSIDGGKGVFHDSAIINITIPNSVTNIGAFSFSGCSQLTGVKVPDSVISIGRQAFDLCSSLTNIELGSNVMTIGYQTFNRCTNLLAITAFEDNPNFSSAEGVLFNKSQSLLIAFPAGKGGSYSIGSSVIRIGDNAFSCCGNLLEIMIPGGVTSIGRRAFATCSGLTNLVVPSTVCSIEAEAFEGCSGITSISLPNSVTNLGSRAFSGCSNLRSITIPNGVRSFEPYLFAGCGSLSSINFGTGITNIAYAAFEYCASLTNLTLPRTITNIAFGSFCESCLVCLTIPGSVTNIDSFAFDRCANLQHVFFEGNAPGLGSYIFYRSYPPRIYYLPGTSGWDSTFAGCLTMLWNPNIQTGKSSFGIRNNHFGFNITGTPDIPIVVEACTNLVNPSWTPMQSCILTNGQFYFSDADSIKSPARLYRIRWP